MPAKACHDFIMILLCFQQYQFLFLTDPIARLVGRSNDLPVIIEVQQVKALLGTGAKVSTMSEQLCKDLGLEVNPLGNLLDI